MLLLQHDDLGELDIDDGEAYVTRSLSLPMPAVRAVVEPRPDADGTRDATAYSAARAVSAQVACFAGDGRTVADAVDALRAYCQPGLRVALVWQHGDSPRRRLIVRADAHDVVYDDSEVVVSSLSLIAPRGLIESDDLHSIELETSFSASGGRDYPLTFNRAYVGAGAPGTAIVNAGSGTYGAWVARLYGPVTDPQIENLRTGEALAFVGLVVPAGSFVELDADAHTARLDGDPEQSVYHYLDPTVSSWWRLQPGETSVRFRAFAFGAGAHAIFEWRDAWL